MKRFRFLIVGLVLAFGVSGCVGDKIHGPIHRHLNVAINENKQLCFYVDKFWGEYNYYLIGIDAVARKNKIIVDYTWQIKNGDQENYHKILDYMWQRNDGNIVDTNGLIGKESYNADHVKQIFNTKIPLTSIDSPSECIPFGKNLSTNNQYKANELKPLYEYRVVFYAKKYNLKGNDDDYMVFDALFTFYYDALTKKYNIKLKK
ncbi:MAG: hypothetical protein JXQ77_05540 [Campylobacterales bacterium]|nr:hypothetical protein [Campylobacterales bacterium]